MARYGHPRGQFSGQSQVPHQSQGGPPQNNRRFSDGNNRARRPAMRRQASARPNDILQNVPNGNRLGSLNAVRNAETTTPGDSDARIQAGGPNNSAELSRLAPPAGLRCELAQEMMMLHNRQVLSEEDPASPSLGHPVLPSVDESATAANSSRLGPPRAANHVSRISEGSDKCSPRKVRSHSLSHLPPGTGDAKDLKVAATVEATSKTRKSAARPRSSSLHWKTNGCNIPWRGSCHSNNTPHAELGNPCNKFVPQRNRHRGRHNGVSDVPKHDSDAVSQNSSKRVSQPIPFMPNLSSFSTNQFQHQQDALRALQMFNNQIGGKSFDINNNLDIRALNNANLCQSSQIHSSSYNLNNDLKNGYRSKTNRGSKHLYEEDYRFLEQYAPMTKESSNELSAYDVSLGGTHGKLRSLCEPFSTRVGVPVPEIGLGPSLPFQAVHPSSHFPLSHTNSRQGAGQWARTPDSESERLPPHLQDILDSTSTPVEISQQRRRHSYVAPSLQNRHRQGLPQHNFSRRANRFNSTGSNSRYNQSARPNFEGAYSSSGSQNSHISQANRGFQHRNAAQTQHENHTIFNDLCINALSESETVASQSTRTDNLVPNSSNESSVEMATGVQTHTGSREKENRTGETSANSASNEPAWGSPSANTTNNTEKLQSQASSSLITQTNASDGTPCQGKSSGTVEKPASTTRADTKEPVPEHQATSQTSTQTRLNPDGNTRLESETVAKQTTRSNHLVSDSSNESSVEMARDAQTHTQVREKEKCTDETSANSAGNEPSGGSSLANTPKTSENGQSQTSSSSNQPSSSGETSCQGGSFGTGEKSARTSADSKEPVPDQALTQTDEEKRLNPDASPFKCGRRSEIQEEMALAQRMCLPVNVGSSRASDHAEGGNVSTHLNPRAKEFSPTLTDSHGKTFTMTNQNGVCYFRPKAGCSHTVPDPRYVIQDDGNDDTSNPDARNTVAPDNELAESATVNEQYNYEVYVQESTRVVFGQQQEEAHVQEPLQQAQQLHHPQVYQPFIQQPYYTPDQQAFNQDVQLHQLQQQQPQPVEPLISSYTPVVTVPNQLHTVPVLDQDVNAQDCGTPAQDYVGHNLPYGNATVDHHPHFMGSSTTVGSSSVLPNTAHPPETPLIPGIQPSHVAHPAAVPRPGLVAPHILPAPSVNPVPMYYPAPYTLAPAVLPAMQTNVPGLVQQVAPVPVQAVPLPQAYTHYSQLLYPYYTLPAAGTGVGVPTYQVYNLHSASTSYDVSNIGLFDEPTYEKSDTSKASPDKKHVDENQTHLPYKLDEALQELRDSVRPPLNSKADRIIDADSEDQLETELSHALAKLMAFKEYGNEEYLKQNIDSLPGHLKHYVDLKLRLLFGLWHENNYCLDASDLHKAMLHLDSITSRASPTVIQDLLRELPEVGRPRSEQERTVERASSLTRSIIKSMEKMNLDTPDSALTDREKHSICGNAAADSASTETGQTKHSPNTNALECIDRVHAAYQILPTVSQVGARTTKASVTSVELSESSLDQVQSVDTASPDSFTPEDRSLILDESPDSLPTPPAPNVSESDHASSSEAEDRRRSEPTTATKPGITEATHTPSWRSHAEQGATEPQDPVDSRPANPSTPHPSSLHRSIATAPNHRGACYDERSPALQKVNINRRIDMFEKMKTGQ